MTRSRQPSSSLRSPETRVRASHPLRPIKALAQAALTRLGGPFDEMYSAVGRPSIPPERLLEAGLPMALYTVRSERLFREQLGYNLLCRWFLDMDVAEESFVPTVFSKWGTASVSEQVLTENRNGPIVDVPVAPATGAAELEEALRMIDESVPGSHRITAGADKNDDTHGFVEGCRERNVTPHVSQNENDHQSSVVDGRTTRHKGY